ncbi:MAG: TIGR04086 family membrane protein [Clostridia bacterium]|nr:TIGR04086 family membrane protein [Clostridia bacterium]
MEAPRRRRPAKKSSGWFANEIKYFAPYWILTFIIALLLIILVALLYIITPLTQTALPGISRTIFIIAELITAYIAGKVTKTSPIVTGLKYGLGLSVILLFIGLISGRVGIFTLEFLLVLFTGILLGMLGSFVGKNYKPAKRRNLNFRNK